MVKFYETFSVSNSKFLIRNVYFDRKLYGYLLTQVYTYIGYCI